MSVSNNIYINSQKLFVIQPKNRDDCDKAKEDEMSRTRSTHAGSEKLIEDFGCKYLGTIEIGETAIEGK